MSQKLSQSFRKLIFVP